MEMHPLITELRGMCILVCPCCGMSNLLTTAAFCGEAANCLRVR
jgi:hypothetical protein